MNFYPFKSIQKISISWNLFMHFVLYWFVGILEDSITLFLVSCSIKLRLLLFISLFGFVLIGLFRLVLSLLRVLFHGVRFSILKPMVDIEYRLFFIRLILATFSHLSFFYWFTEAIQNCNFPFEISTLNYSN